MTITEQYVLSLLNKDIILYIVIFFIDETGLTEHEKAIWYEWD